jgi:hypothetical protein
LVEWKAGERFLVLGSWLLAGGSNLTWSEEQIELTLVVLPCHQHIEEKIKKRRAQNPGGSF